MKNTDKQSYARFQQATCINPVYFINKITDFILDKFDLDDLSRASSIRIYALDSKTLKRKAIVQITKNTVIIKRVDSNGKVIL